MKRRKWMPKKKLIIALEGLEAKCTIAELCNQHQISQICSVEKLFDK